MSNFLLYYLDCTWAFLASTLSDIEPRRLASARLSWGIWAAMLFDTEDHTEDERPVGAWRLGLLEFLP